MDTERGQDREREAKKLTPEQEKLLLEIEEITRLRTGDVDKIHGIEHVETVARIAKYLAHKEDADVFEVTMAAWLHDWGRVRETERQEKGDKQPHAKVSRTKSQRLVLQPLLNEGKITEKEYQRILAVIESHSKLPEGKMLEKKVLRDADRLSRLSAMGLLQVVTDAKDSGGLPLYVEGQPIIRPREKIRLQDLKCVIDNINLVIGFYCSFETKAAKRLADKFELPEIYEEFLRTFAKYKDVVSQEMWEKWIASVAEESKKQRDEIEQESKEKNKEIGIEEILASEAPDAFSEENFRKFLKTENLDI